MTDTLSLFPVPVLHRISGPIGERILCTTGAAAENSEEDFSEELAPPLYKNQVTTGAAAENSEEDFSDEAAPPLYKNLSF